MRVLRAERSVVGHYDHCLQPQRRHEATGAWGKLDEPSHEGHALPIHLPARAGPRPCQTAHYPPHGQPPVVRGADGSARKDGATCRGDLRRLAAGDVPALLPSDDSSREPQGHGAGGWRSRAASACSSQPAGTSVAHLTPNRPAACSPAGGTCPVVALHSTPTDEGSLAPAEEVVDWGGTLHLMLLRQSARIGALFPVTHRGGKQDAEPTGCNVG